MADRKDLIQKSHSFYFRMHTPLTRILIICKFSPDVEKFQTKLNISGISYVNLDKIVEYSKRRVLNVKDIYNPIGESEASWWLMNATIPTDCYYIFTQFQSKVAYKAKRLGYLVVIFESNSNSINLESIPHDLVINDLDDIFKLHAKRPKIFEDREEIHWYSKTNVDCLRYCILKTYPIIIEYLRADSMTIAAYSAHMEAGSHSMIKVVEKTDRYDNIKIHPCRSKLEVKKPIWVEIPSGMGKSKIIKDLIGTEYEGRIIDGDSLFKYPSIKEWWKKPQIVKKLENEHRKLIQAFKPSTNIMVLWSATGDIVLDIAMYPNYKDFLVRTRSRISDNEEKIKMGDSDKVQGHYAPDKKGYRDMIDNINRLTRKVVHANVVLTTETITELYDKHFCFTGHTEWKVMDIPLDVLGNRWFTAMFVCYGYNNVIYYNDGLLGTMSFIKKLTDQWKQKTIDFVKTLSELKSLVKKYRKKKHDLLIYIGSETTREVSEIIGILRDLIQNRKVAEIIWHRSVSDENLVAKFSVPFSVYVPPFPGEYKIHYVVWGLEANDNVYMEYDIGTCINASDEMDCKNWVQRTADFIFALGYKKDVKVEKFSEVSICLDPDMKKDHKKNHFEIEVGRYPTPWTGKGSDSAKSDIYQFIEDGKQLLTIEETITLLKYGESFKKKFSTPGFTRWASEPDVLYVAGVELYHPTFTQTIFNGVSGNVKWYSATLIATGLITPEEYFNIRARVIQNQGGKLSGLSWIGFMGKKKKEIQDVSGHLANLLHTANFRPIDFKQYFKVLEGNILLYKKNPQVLSDYNHYRRRGLLGERHFGINELKDVFHSYDEYLLAIESYELHAHEYGLWFNTNYVRKALDKLLKEYPIFSEVAPLLYKNEEKWLNKGGTSQLNHT